MVTCDNSVVSVIRETESGYNFVIVEESFFAEEVKRELGTKVTIFRYGMDAFSGQKTLRREFFLLIEKRSSQILEYIIDIISGRCIVSTYSVSSLKVSNVLKDIAAQSHSLLSTSWAVNNDWIRLFMLSMGIFLTPTLDQTVSIGISVPAFLPSFTFFNSVVGAIFEKTFLAGIKKNSIFDQRFQYIDQIDVVTEIIVCRPSRQYYIVIETVTEGPNNRVMFFYNEQKMEFEEFQLEIAETKESFLQRFVYRDGISIEDVNYYSYLISSKEIPNLLIALKKEVLLRTATKHLDQVITTNAYKDQTQEAALTHEFGHQGK